MKTVTKEKIEEIRAANDIVEIIGSYLPLKRAGNSFKALCPFHKEKTPSFHVNPQRQIYHCFGCGAGGDVFRFIMEYEGVDFNTALRMLARRAGIRLEFHERKGEKSRPDKEAVYRALESAARFFNRTLRESPAADPARKYLAARDLPGELVSEFLIGYAPPTPEQFFHWARETKLSGAVLQAAGLVVAAEGKPREFYPRFRGRLMFPIHDEAGRVVGFSGRVLAENQHPAKYVNTPETIVFQKSRLLFALHKARHAILEKREALLCEGQIDVIRCHQAGLRHAVAAQGTAITDEQARILKRYADTVVFLLDADKAGEDAAVRAAPAFLNVGLELRIAVLPPGEDPDSLIRRDGAAAVESIIRRASGILDFQLDVLSRRDDLSTEAGLLRVARALVETIRHTGSAVQREHMLVHAAGRLGLHPRTLAEEMQRVRVRSRFAPTPSPGGNAPAPPPAPAEEFALAELVIRHPETRAEVRRYLPLEMIRHEPCRILVHTALDSDQENILPLLDETRRDCISLLAQIESAPLKFSADAEKTPLDAVRDVILTIRRRALDSRRRELRRRLREEKDPAAATRLRAEDAHLVMVVNALRQGWEKARDMLEID